MKTKYLLLIALIITISFSSCEKIIEFNGGDVKTKLVLNGLLMPDSLVKVKITESRFFLDDDGAFKEINNANVELWKDNNKIEKLSNIGEGYYIGSYIPKTGDNIRITASCDGFDQIECSTEIAIPTSIISADTINYHEDISYNGYYEDGLWLIDSTSYNTYINFEMNITFKDPKDIPNYYSLNVYLKCNYSDGESFSLPFMYNSDDLVFQKRNNMDFLDDDNNNYLQLTIFNDELFDGKEYKLKIKTDNKYIGIRNNQSDPETENPEFIGMEISVELQSLSQAYYMYLKTHDAYLNMDNLMEYFAEPIQIYSNVKGGIGILGSYSKSVFTIPLE